MSNPPKILWVAPNYNNHGGLERYNHEVVESLIAAGGQVHAICLFECSRPDDGNFSSITLSPSWWPAKKIFGKRWPHILNRTLTEYSAPVDLVIAGHIFCLPAALLLAKKRGVPCWVLTFGIEVWGSIKPEYAQGLREVDRVISISEFTKDMMQKSSGRMLPIDIIAPSTDIGIFKPVKIPRSDGKIRLLTVGRLAGRERYKGHDIVIDALRILRDMNLPDIEYWIVGDGDDRKRIEQHTRENDVAGQVHFLGRIEDDRLPKIYNCCDIFIMPSFVAEQKPGVWTGEGFGIVYLEASACEKPVIGCDIGGQTDCILDGKTGLLIKPNAAAAAEAISRLVRHPEEAKSMGQEGRRFVEENFTLPHFRLKWARLLKEFLP